MKKLLKRLARAFEPEPPRLRSREEIDRAVRRGESPEVSIPDPRVHLPRI